jgi:hypothetical protein
VVELPAFERAKRIDLHLQYSLRFSFSSRCAFGDDFFRITQYIGDTYNARTLISMNTRTQTLPLGALKTVPANPQD